MPYRTNAELPESVKHVLPSHAQDMYRDAFNHAWDEYADPAKRRNNASQEETARRVAWGAVKKLYEKEGERWVKKKF
ncbi:MAG TPA: ChaB family protein [Syntrophales bacterium]|nr:ChaB family protein [Syntrophales bacterium]